MVSIIATCLPGDSMVKNPPANARDVSFDSWVRKILWRGKWQPTPVFLRQNPIDRGAWWATVLVVAESDITE